MGALQNASGVDLGTADTTSAEISNNPQIDAGPATTQGGVNAARAAADNTTGAMGDDVESSPEEQQAYDQAMKAAETVLYVNDQTADAIGNMINSERKIESVAKASLMAVTKIDQKIDMPEEIIAQVSMDITDMIIDLAEEGKGMQFSEKETQAVWGTVWEGVMDAYGVDEDEYNSFTADMSDEDIASQEQAHKGFLGE
jgi:hypothetical protein